MSHEKDREKETTWHLTRKSLAQLTNRTNLTYFPSTLSALMTPPATAHLTPSVTAHPTNRLPEKLGIGNKVLQGITTPAGAVLNPFLSAPDERFDELGVYKTEMILSRDDLSTQSLMKHLNEMADQAYKMAKHNCKSSWPIRRLEPYLIEYDEMGKPTANIIIQARKRAKTKDKRGIIHDCHLHLFDSKGKRILRPPKIGDGSIICLNISLAPFFAVSCLAAGVSLHMNAVQILNLGSDVYDGAQFGFTVKSGGYEVPSSPPPNVPLIRVGRQISSTYPHQHK